MRWRSAAVAAVAAVVIGVSYTVAHQVAAGAAVAHLTPNSKRTCVYSANKLDRLAEFQKLVTTKIDCAVVFNDVAAQWPDWEDAWFVSAGADQPNLQWPHWVAGDRAQRTLIITQSLIPTGAPKDWRAQGAAGAYDAHIRTLLSRYVAAGLGDCVIRLAHEANGDWYADSIGATAADHAQWRAYWRHFVAVARTVKGAHFTFDWTVNPGYRPIPLADYYPGDDVVDDIGVDIYDDAPKQVGTTQPARWQHQWSQPYGVGAVVAFAKAHGKPLTIPEWGLRSGSLATGAGDDAYFVDQVSALVQSTTTSYQAYFDADTEGVLRLAAAPHGLQAWKGHFARSGS